MSKSKHGDNSEKRKYFFNLFKSNNEFAHEEAEEASNMYRLELQGVLDRCTRNKIRNLYNKHVTSEEDIIINDVLGMMDDPLQIAHFFLGGHIQFEGDGTTMYQKWVKQFGNKVVHRQSSHVTVDPQWALDGNVVEHILVGTRYKNPEDTTSAKYTWLQLENNPIGGFEEFKRSPLSFIINAILYLLDYINYKISKKNIGPHGHSEYTEANPLIIDVSKVTPEIAEKRKNLWKIIILDLQGNISGFEQDMLDAGMKLPRHHEYKSTKVN